MFACWKLYSQRRSKRVQGGPRGSNRMKCWDVVSTKVVVPKFVVLTYIASALVRSHFVWLRRLSFERLLKRSSFLHLPAHVPVPCWPVHYCPVHHCPLALFSGISVKSFNRTHTRRRLGRLIWLISYTFLHWPPGLKRELAISTDASSVSTACVVHQLVHFTGLFHWLVSMAWNPSVGCFTSLCTSMA